MQDMEFTIENKKLFMLQTRNGKRTAKAALKIACDLVDEGMRTEEEAVLMIDPRNLDTLLHPQFDTVALKKAQPIGRGLAASPGAACGKIVFTAADAKAWKVTPAVQAVAPGIQPGQRAIPAGDMANFDKPIPPLTQDNGNGDLPF
jgi:phosphoenolpyruvate synthase/pyruvate phosphate dikinase